MNQTTNAGIDLDSLTKRVEGIAQWLARAGKGNDAFDLHALIDLARRAEPSVAADERARIEEAAKAIYRLFDGAETHPWVEGGNSNKQDDARRYARAALASPAVPEGYKLVPIEPTPAQQQAGHDTPGAHGYNASYRAMVKAAPAVSQKAAPEVPVDGAAQLLDALANKGGAIVSTASLNTAQIAAARVEGRMYVREDGCGFVHAHPPTKGFSVEPYRKFMADWAAGWSTAPSPATQQAVSQKDGAAEPDAFVRAMNKIAQDHAHGLALELECILYDYSGKWCDSAMAKLSAYREAMNAIHERESPAHMGEPVLFRPIAAATTTSTDDDNGGAVSCSQNLIQSYRRNGL